MTAIADELDTDEKPPLPAKLPEVVRTPEEVEADRQRLLQQLHALEAERETQRPKEP